MTACRSGAHEAIAALHLPTTIRERCHHLLTLASHDRLEHFAYHPEQLPAVVDYVLDITYAAYPTLVVPLHSRWRHFAVNAHDRLAQLEPQLSSYSTAERARWQFDLIITSVLLDAGAGAHWRYQERTTGATYTRSEGLAVASLHAFLSGLFSSQPQQPWQADAAGLQRLSPAALAQALQVTPTNPLLALESRAALLQALGATVAQSPRYFGSSHPRVGHLFDYLCAQSTQGVLSAERILLAVLDSLGPIWPGRLKIQGVNLGDVWRHRLAAGVGPSAGLVPLHKLSQWLTYSLIEPLMEAGLTVTGLNDLTALAEYRNGGLLLDMAVLSPKHDAVLGVVHPPEAEVVVEWRALTVALLDHVADGLRSRLALSVEDFPLAKVLEGGTWRAGRAIALEKRPDGSPPLHVLSDGTVL